MLTDTASIVLALVALHFSDLPVSWERTYGYRRLRTVPDVERSLMLGIGLAGLVANVLAMLVPRKSAKGTLHCSTSWAHCRDH